MASSIHHGAPGSFKSFTLVQRFAIDALKEGRVVVTNIRGLTSLERILDQFPDVVFPDSASLIYIHTETAAGRAIMAGWFHWVPFGALVLMDEGQRVYPDRNDFKLERLDVHVCPDNYQIQELHIVIQDDYTGQTFEIGRPEDVFTAFDMQRHFQWDIFISTTHINKIKTQLRESCQTAYRHSALSGKIPFLFKNTWYEFQHHPSNAGLITAHQIGNPRKYKADPRIFKCYQSTATGEHTENKADQSILGDSGVRFKLGFLVVALLSSVVLVFLHFSTKEDLHKNSAAAVAPVDVPVPSAAPVPAPVSSQNPIAVVRDVVVNGHGGKTNDLADHLGYKVLSIAYHDTRDKEHEKLSFVVDSPKGLKVVNYADFAALGVKAYSPSLCMVYLVYDGQTTEITCNHASIDKCSANMKSGYIVSRHNCRKYSDDDNNKEQTITAAIKDNRAVMMAQAAN